MKKVLFLCLMFVCGSLFAEDFEWADYEKLCWQNNKEPSYEEYEWLCENPQCYGEDLSIIMEP